MLDRDIPSENPADADPVGGLNPLAVAARRWPLLLVGLAVGAVVGVLWHLSSTPQYQSRADLLVVRKLGNVGSTGGGDARLSVIEDYVGAQLNIIKSEKVRRAAAAELRKVQAQLSPATRLPDDDGAVAEMIRGGLAVMRDKETAAAGTIGNGIVILTFRWPDPTDAKIFLEAHIRAYQGELVAVYSSASEEQLRGLEKSIDANQKDQLRLSNEKQKLDLELWKITSEPIPAIQTRVTADTERLSVLDTEMFDAQNILNLIKSAGPDRRDRLAVLAQLTGQTRPGITLADQPEQNLRAKELARKSLAQRLGPDHERMQELDAEIQFLKDEIARLNPSDPTGTLDELKGIEKKSLYALETAKLKKQRLEAQVAKDKLVLEAAVVIRSKIEGLDLERELVKTAYNGLRDKRNQTDVTKDNGGYSANAVTPPGIGGKVYPVLFQSLLFGLVVGVLLGGGAMALAEVTDRSFKSPGEIRRRLGLPVIGHIPQLREAPADPDTPAGLQPALVTALRPKSIEAEAYRGVRTQLYFSTQGRGHQVIQVTSPNPGDGKSTLAANLAVSIAQSGKRTVLIDCDFRKPQVHKIFGLDRVEAGLASVVAGSAPTARALRRSAVENLDLMPCGPRPDNPAELLTSPRFQQLIADLKDTYDFVIVDTPPVLAVSDPAAVAPRVDGVIIVFRMTKYARPAAERTREQLAALGANVLGVVVNGGSAGGGAGYNGYNYGSNAGYRYTQYEYAEQYADDDGKDSQFNMPARP